MQKQQKGIRPHVDATGAAVRLPIRHALEVERIDRANSALSNFSACCLMSAGRTDSLGARESLLPSLMSRSATIPPVTWSMTVSSGPPLANAITGLCRRARPDNDESSSPGKTRSRSSIQVAHIVVGRLPSIDVGAVSGAS